MSFNSALTQTLILGGVFFFLPGGYNAINSMAGGIGNQAVIAHGNTILNVLFAVASLFAPISVNMLGPRITLFVGALGYPLYIVALLYSGLEGAPDYWILVASAILGLCAALTWTAQGTLIMAYPTPEKKGSYFSYFWIIFNAGGVCNSLAIFASNLGSKGDSAVTAGTFWVFIVVMLVGCALVLLLQPLNKVVRPDGSSIEVAPEPAVIPEIIGMAKLFVDPRAVALVPLFLYTNWCYNYQFQIFNDPLFDTPTKGLNNVF
jgi:MFS family permease